MNDCFWCWIGCDDRKCRCSSYMSLNSEKGREIERKYDEEIEEAIKPIKEKYLKLKNS